MKTLTNKDITNAAKNIGCDEAAIRAVVDVESRGNGFLSSGEPVILFEGHVFHRLTGGKYSTIENHNISHPAWLRKYYRQDQHQRLQKASALDRDAALKSASWGLFQIMGFNHKSAGFRNLQDFINAMYHSEGRQLEAFVNFIKSEGIAKHLISKNWSEFARRYNGKSYKANRYDTRLQKAYQRHSR